MNQIINRSSLLIIALLLGIGAMAACGTGDVKNSGAQTTNTTGKAGDQTAAGNKAAEVTPSVAAAEAEPGDIFSTFKNGQDYKTAVRPKILKDGWQPARTDEGKENCQNGPVQMCQEYPELESGPAAGMGNILFRWKKGEKTLLIHTVDDPPVYTGYEFEKVAKPSNPSDLAGKYEFSAVGISGDHKLELKSNKSAVIKIFEEDGTTTGTGSWSWDDAKELLTVTVTVTFESEGTDGTEEKPKPKKGLFQFKREGRNLKIVNQTLDDRQDYAGKIFKRV